METKTGNCFGSYTSVRKWEKSSRKLYIQNAKHLSSAICNIDSAELNSCCSVLLLLLLFSGDFKKDEKNMGLSSMYNHNWTQQSRAWVRAFKTPLIFCNKGQFLWSNGKRDRRIFTCLFLTTMFHCFSPRLNRNFLMNGDRAGAELLLIEP